MPLIHATQLIVVAPLVSNCALERSEREVFYLTVFSFNTNSEKEFVQELSGM
jgi:TctA family transporter